MQLKKDLCLTDWFGNQDYTLLVNMAVSPWCHTNKQSAYFCKGDITLSRLVLASLGRRSHLIINLLFFLQPWWVVCNFTTTNEIITEHVVPTMAHKIIWYDLNRQWKGEIVWHEDEVIRPGLLQPSLYWKVGALNRPLIKKAISLPLPNLLSLIQLFFQRSPGWRGCVLGGRVYMCQGDGGWRWWEKSLY